MGSKLGAVGQAGERWRRSKGRGNEGQDTGACLKSPETLQLRTADPGEPHRKVTGIRDQGKELRAGQKCPLIPEG